MFIEIAVTGEKRSHTLASLRLRLRLAALSVPHKDKTLFMQGYTKRLEIRKSEFREWNSTLDAGQFIQPALPSDAWGVIANAK